MNNINTTFTLTAEQQTALLRLTKTINADAIITDNFNSSTMDCAELLSHGLVFLDKNGVPMSSVPRYLGLTAMGCYGYNNEDFNRTLVESFAAVLAKRSLILSKDSEADSARMIVILSAFVSSGVNVRSPITNGVVKLVL